MNAFMIFARRRRPQVSAENQAMRTGEISKILSKEWAVMLPVRSNFFRHRPSIAIDELAVRKAVLSRPRQTVEGEF